MWIVIHLRQIAFCLPTQFQVLDVFFSQYLIAFHNHTQSGRPHCHDKPQSPFARVPASVHRWEKPAGDQVKVNCDAAFDPNTWNVGWGCVLRGSDGDMVVGPAGGELK